jgi:hypothetical protein
MVPAAGMLPGPAPSVCSGAARSALKKSHFPMINVTKQQVSCLLLDRKQGYSVAS